MKRLLSLLLCTLALATTSSLWAGDAPPPDSSDPAFADETARNNAFALAARSRSVAPRSPDFLEHLVDGILALFDVRSNESTTSHYVISVSLLVVAFLLRRAITGILFAWLKKLAARTSSTLDDKLLPALELPVGTFVMVTGIFGALNVLKLSPATDRYIGYGSTVAFSLVFFWGLLRAFGALLDHAQERAIDRELGIAAFMPWIKKTLVTLFVIFGVLMVVQTLGFDVKALLAGLGIGGLAFALAAQDTLANLFGSIVVAIDQPFKVGDAVKIGASEGTVEDIGLRSTKLRTPAKNLIIIPNKLVAAEPVINHSRFVQRRVEQVIGLTYDTNAEQMDAIVEDFRKLILGEEEVDATSVMVFFRDYSASSLDVWVVYHTKDPDHLKSMQLRQRVNLAMMRAVEARGLSFAFPTQTLHLVRPVPAPQDSRKA